MITVIFVPRVLVPVVLLVLSCIGIVTVIGGDLSLWALLILIPLLTYASIALFAQIRRWVRE